MSTKTTDLWLSRDRDGSYCISRDEPVRINENEDWDWWVHGDWEQPDMFGVPSLRKGTKRRIRVTVEVLR